MSRPRSVALAAAAVGNLLHGWDSSAIAGALLYIKPEFHLEENPRLEGFVVGAPLIAAVISTICAGPSADRLGRRTMLCVSACFLSLSGCIMLWSPDVYILLLGRLLSGAGIGLVATTVPVLIAECAPAETRGQLSTLPQVAGTGGQFISYCIVFSLSLQSSPNWRLMLGILSIPSICYLFICILLLPESPRWLVSKGDMLAAKTVLQNLRDNIDVTAEFALIVEGLEVGVEAVEEYLQKPADIDYEVANSKLDATENIMIYDPADSLSWIMTPLLHETGLHALVARNATTDLGIINPLVDSTVTLLDCIQTNIDKHLEHEPEKAENQILNKKWDEENQRMGNDGNDDLRRPLLSGIHRTDIIDAPNHDTSSILPINTNHNHSNNYGSLFDESFDSIPNIARGWHLAWKWAGTKVDEQEESATASNFKPVIFVQEYSEPLNAESETLNVPCLGVPVEADATQAAALVSQHALYAIKDVCNGEPVVPEMLHPSEISPQKKLQWSNFAGAGIRRALGVGMGIQFFQQVCGIKAVLYYTPQILQQSGVYTLLSRAAAMSPESFSILASTTTCFLMLPCVLIAMRWIDRSGRRTMLLATLPVLAVSLTAVAVTTAALPAGLIQLGISYLGLSIFTCTFAAGFGPIPNILCSEIFPTRVRGVCTSFCSATMWVSNAVIMQGFPILLSAIGFHGVLAFFAAMSVLSWLFAFLKVPETKGLALEVICELFAMADAVDCRRTTL